MSEEASIGMREMLLRIACMDKGPKVDDSFDEPDAARAARVLLARDFIGPCMHGRDPWGRCDEPECADEVSAWAHAHVNRKEVPR